MEENNSMDQENGFVMRDEPENQPGQRPHPEPESQPGQQPHPGSGFQSQQQPYQESGAQSEQQSYSESESQSGQQAYSQPEPQPMPSNDNLYRFQNTTPQKPVKEPKQGLKNGTSWAKVILSAAVFGVVAAGCFFGVNKVLGSVTGGDSIAEVKATQPRISLTSVSGVAIAGPVDVSAIVEQVMPSIVAITEKSTQRSYFGQTYSSEGAGSGFIVKQDNDQLLIVTNNHVVANADQISVQFNDGESVDAIVKGTSESNDLAVLTVELGKLKESTKKSIKVASLGSSNDAKVGQMVIAIGNALGYGQSVTVGYVSAKDREVSSSDESGGQSTTQVLLQTDAAINPGNSGGALIDTNGNVIGINSSKYFAYGNTTVEGMGYAIPMSDAISVINDLMDRQVLKDEEKGYLGITGRTIDETVSDSYGIPVGVYVAAVSDTGAAYKAGIKQGDVITEIDDRQVRAINEVQEIVNNTKVGTEITVTVKRSSDGEYKEKQVKVTLKSKDTLDGLDFGSDDGQGGSQNNPQGNGGYNQNDPQVVPWGGSIY